MTGYELFRKRIAPVLFQAPTPFGLELMTFAHLHAIPRRQVLAALEKGEQSGAVTRLADDLPLFAAAPTRPAGLAKQQESEVEKALGEINPDELSPREALELLYSLRQRIKP